MKGTAGIKMKSKRQRDPRGRGRVRGHRDGSDLKKDLELIQADPRFAHIASDPKFRHVPKEQRKVKLDSRFRSVLTDDKFYEKSTMDPRGKKGNFSTREDLMKFYHMSSSDDDDDDNEESSGEEEDESDDKVDSSGEEKTAPDDKGSKKEMKDDIEGGENADAENDGNADNEGVVEDDDGLEVAPEVTRRLRDLTFDYARGGTDLFSDDSSDDDSSTTEDEDVDGEFEWGELDKDAVWDDNAEETSRLAVCNLDWDRIKAADLMVLFTSFCPRGGSVRCVTIYPSEYGKQRMTEEDYSGPQELRMTPRGDSNDIEAVDLEKLEKGQLDTNAGSTKVHFEALRRYQRNRLRYFYAILECDSVDTARALYQECDRQPFEGAGFLLDLRYIPSDMTFDETPHDECHTVPQTYESKSFITSALQSTRPLLTWDETDPDRRKALFTAMTKAIKGEDLDNECLRGFIASSSEDEDEDNPSTSNLNEDSCEEEEEDDNEDKRAARIAKFRALIQEIDEKERKRKEQRIDMEETLDESEDNKDNDDEDEDEEEEDKEEEKKKEDTLLNPFEKYIEKRRQKKKEKREQMKMKKKGKKKDDSEDSEDELISDDEVPGGADDLYSDPFFAEEMKKMKNRKKIRMKVKQTPKEEDEGDSEDKSRGNLELLLMNEDTEDKKHFNMREIIQNSETNTKKRRKNKMKKKMLEKQKEKQNKVDDFKVNISDARFSELLMSGEYNIDPSHPQFKRTPAMERLIGDIQRKRIAECNEDVPGAKKPNLSHKTKEQELSTLISRVKRKTEKVARKKERSQGIRSKIASKS